MKREVAIYLRAYNSMKAGLASANASLQAFRTKANAIILGIAKTGALAFVALGASSAVVGARFEQSMANVGSLMTGLYGSGSKLDSVIESLTVKAREIGSTTAYTASQASEAMYSLASSGMTANEVFNSTEGVTKLAGATMGEMGTSAELVASSLRVFGLDATETDRVVNVFGAGIQNSMLNLSRLSESMKYASPVANQLGMSVEETTGALAVLHNAGLKGSMAGTGLRMVLAKLAKGGDDLKKVLGETTVESDGFSAVIGKIEEAGLSAGEMFNLFGTRAASGILASLSAGKAGLDDMTEAVTGTQSAYEMYEVQMNTTKNQANILKSAVEDLMIEIFRGGEAGDGFGDKLTDGFRRASAWVNENKKVVAEAMNKIINVLARAVSLALNLLGQLWSSVTGLWDSLGWLRDAFSATFGFLERNSELITGAIKGLAIFATVLYTVSTAFAIFNAVVAMNPISMIIIGIGVLIAIISALVEKLRAVVEELGGWGVVWAKTKEIVDVAIEKMRFQFKRLASHIKNNLLDAKMDILIFVENAKYSFALIGATLKAGGKFYWAYLKTVVIVLKGVWGAVKQMGRNVGEAMSNLGKVITDPLNARKHWERAKKSLSVNMSDVASGVKNEVASIWSSTADSVSAEFVEIRSEHKATVDGIRSDTKTAIDANNKQLEDEAQASSERIVEIAKTAKVEIDRIKSDTGVGEAEKVVDESGTGESGTGEFGIDTSDLSNDVNAVRDEVLVVADEMESALGSSFDNAWGSILDSSKTGAEKMKAIWSNLGSSIFGVIGKIVKAQLFGDKVSLASAEGTTGAKLTLNEAETGSNLRTAVSGFFKAYSSLPFIGQALALGGIALMMKMISKFYEGGIVTGPSGRDNVLAMVTAGEYVMPVEQTARYRGELDAMRSGRYEGTRPNLIAGGSGGGDSGGLIAVTNHIHIGENGLLITEDSISMRRFAEQIDDITQDTIKKNYRED